MSDIIVRDLVKKYDGHMVLNHFNATFPKGKMTVIMAPSGKGKTTLLRILMGLERYDSGEIIGVTGQKKSAVFQEDCLCENLNAISNIKLCNSNLDREVIQKALINVGINAPQDQRVREFSGGMKRRVAICRALLAEHDILFLDEPFKGIDKEQKKITMDFMKNHILNTTTIYITHDSSEADFFQPCQIIEL